jgi:L-threonine kinase
MAFGTFGELVQGVLPDGSDFLVTFPIARWSTAYFRLGAGGPLRVQPAHKRKSLLLARTMLEAAGCRDGGSLALRTDLPEGKGLASSSADLVATARAVSAALGLPASAPAIEAWLRPIEPTDGVMYPGVVAFDHRQVRLRAFLGRLPPISVVAHDEGGRFDTVEFNRLAKPFNAADRREYSRLLEGAARAIRFCDLDALGEVATRSAVLHDKLRPRPLLPRMRQIAGQVGALGVLCTHSGTLLGLLFAEDRPEFPYQLARARHECGRLPGTVSVFRSLSFLAEGLHLSEPTGQLHAA